VAGKPLAGLGQTIKLAESIYNIRADYILSHAILESAWGTSKVAQDKHNLYGFGAARGYDSFDSFAECIFRVMAYVKFNYLVPAGQYYVAPTLSGMNTHYAEDKEWSNKIASIMQQLHAAFPQPEDTYDKIVTENQALRQKIKAAQDALA
jgi:beta-N-acetylglucosaminidase